MTTFDGERILRAVRDELDRADDPAKIDDVRRRYLGKTGELRLALAAVKQLPPDQRPAFAREVNRVTQAVERAIDAAGAAIADRALGSQLEQDWIDRTLPGASGGLGAIHPLTRVEYRCMDVLRRLGFVVEEGPEVESAFYNFDALNIPEHHPARDMQDTFWVDGGLCLRSHTTPVQARILERRLPPPIKVASFGRVYRNEKVDATHLAMFHQFEGFWIERGINFTHLKGVLDFVARALYGAEQRFRFKPKYYPYTEPSVGMDMACTHCQGKGCGACHDAGWVTILGSGMVHRKVLERFGYDPEVVGGIAFGLGTTRMAAQPVGTNRLKALYELDLRRFHNPIRGAS